MTQGKTPTLTGIPVDEIQEAMKSFQTVKLRVSRRNDRGQLAMVVAGVLIPIEQLTDIDAYLSERYGGGQYRVEPCNPNGTTPPYICAPFNIFVEGPPRPPMKGPPQPMDANGQAMMPNPYNPYGYPMAPAPPAYGPTVPQMAEIPAAGWAQGLHPSQANAYIQAGNQMFGPPGAFGTVPFRSPKESQMNPVYDNNIAFLRGDLAKAQAEAKSATDKLLELTQRHKDDVDKLTREFDRKLDDMRRDHENKIRELEKSHERDERTWERERQDMRERALRAELSANNSPKSNGMGDTVTALVPALTAYIQSSSQRDAQAAQNQLEMLRIQTMSKGEDPTMGLIKVALPLLLPLIQQNMAAKSPEAMATLIEAMQSNQMQSTGMLIQLIDQMMPEEKPVWAQVLMAAFERMQDVGEKFMKGMNADAAPQQARGLPPPRQQQVQAQPAPQQAQAQPARQAAPVDTVAQQIDSMLMPQLPQSFQTQEWRNIVVAIAKKVPAEPLAKMVSDHLGFLIKNDMVPEELTDPETVAAKGSATKAFQVQPVDGLDGLVRPLVGILNLPGEYVQEVMFRTLVQLSEADLIDWEPPSEEEMEAAEDEEEVETLEEAGIEHEAEHEYS